MINYTLNDATQRVILPELKKTEELIMNAIEKETGMEAAAEIVAMPDLGLANNSIRMRGGFFTGMFVQWESKIPFVPVDSTVNSCGVSVFLLRDKMTQEQFVQCIKLAKKRVASLSYHWNFERGNHFISLCRLDYDRQCVVLHASADEYKKSIKDKALYPLRDVWYYDKVKTLACSDDSGRYLRYLVGTDAEKFIEIATGLEAVNHARMNDIAGMAFGNFIEKEVLYVPHYGMPTPSSIAIGCSWKNDRAILLTRPQKSIYIIKPEHLCTTSLWLTPHGFGSSISSTDISYFHGLLSINGIRIETDEDVQGLKGKGIRLASSTDEEIKYHVEKILDKSNAVVDVELHQIACLNCDGFA